jgi:hypothetical protein
MVADHIGEVGAGLAKGQAHSQSPGLGGLQSVCPSLLQLHGKILAYPGHTLFLLALVFLNSRMSSH